MDFSFTQVPKRAFQCLRQLSCVYVSFPVFTRAYTVFDVVNRHNTCENNCDFY